MIQVEGTFGGGAKLNGIKGNYLATADVAKGDFVQLTTWGVEEPKLEEVLSWASGDNSAKCSSVAILSSTQVIVVWHTGTDYVNTANTVEVYAQIISRINGVWVAGTALLLTSFSTKHRTVGVGRLTNTRAAVFVHTSSGYSKVLVLDVSESGELTVSAESVPTFSINGTESCTASAHVLAFSPEKFIIAGGGTSWYSYAAVCTYVNGVLSVYDKTEIANHHDGTANFGLCKLNEAAFLVKYTYANEDEDATYYIRAHYVGDTTITSYIANISARGSNATYAGAMPVYMEDNKCLLCSAETSKAKFQVVTFDPVASTLTLDVVNAITSISAGSLYNSAKLSDNKVITWAYRSPVYNSVIYDINTGEATNYAYPALSLVTAEAANSSMTDAAFGWFALIEGSSKLWIAPCISQTTAAPYFTRLDGVATKGASAGGMAQVVTPD